jgi:hypothetical protein
LENERTIPQRPHILKSQDLFRKRETSVLESTMGGAFFCLFLELGLERRLQAVFDGSSAVMAIG